MDVSSYLRIGGLASGMDIDSIVNDLMKVERLPLEKLEQEKQIWEWKKEDYQKINSSLNELRETVFNMKLESTFMQKKAVSSNEDAVSVQANSNAVPGIYTVTVDSLAEGVFKGSTSSLEDETDGSGNTKTLFEQFQAEFESRGYNSASSISFTLKGTPFSFNIGTDSIYTVVSQINDSDLGVTASYDKEQNRFFLTTTTTGSAAEITVTGDNANFLSNGAANSSMLKLNLDENTTYSGKDAIFDFGDAQGLTSASNTVIINGLTLEFKQGGTVSSTITVKNDTEAVLETIKGFVEQYNQVLGEINCEFYEKRNRDYPPLTEVQRKEISEREIELWEEKARSGMLSNDRILSGIISDMRKALYRTVKGLEGYDDLYDIGITTKSYEYRGELQVDEDKLRSALENDFESVMDLFTNRSYISGEEGIAVQLYDQIVRGIEKISDEAGSTSGYSMVDNSFIGRKLENIAERMQEWQERLVVIENRYWNQFVTMEKAIDRINMQAAWLAQQFGGGASLQR